MYTKFVSFHVTQQLHPPELLHYTSLHYTNHLTPQKAFYDEINDGYQAAQ